MPRNDRIVLRTFFLPAIFLLSFCSFGARAAAAGAVVANPYEAPAREFARRIAASFPAETRVGVDVRNHSTLAAGDVAAVRAALLDELSARGLRVAAPAAGYAGAQATAAATITLSENAAGFVWVAEIRQGDRSAVMLMAVPRASTPAAEISAITLRSALLWSGPEDVLAAAAPAAPDAAPNSIAAGGANLLLLVSDGGDASLTDAQHTFKIALPPSANAARDAQGALAWNGTLLNVTGNGQTCTLSLPLATSQPQCRAGESPTPPAPTDQLGSQHTELPAACGGASAEILAAGTGDYTQPDSVRAYEMRGGAAEPVSAALDFPGPVMSLQAAMLLQSQPGPAALAVVRNLATGDDEVYEISLVCGH
jgi:hypothetical protein